MIKPMLARICSAIERDDAITMAMAPSTSSTRVTLMAEVTCEPKVEMCAERRLLILKVYR